MTSKVILQPAGDSDALGHYVDTIQNPVEINRIKSFLSPEQNAELAETFQGRAAIPVWGVTPGKNGANVSKWNRIDTGDVTLFSRQGKIFASATVVAKIHNKELALDLWTTNSNGDTWEYVYFLDELIDQNIPYSIFNEVVGYQPNYVIQGFNILDETKSNLLLNGFDLRSMVYFPDLAENDYLEAVTSLTDADNLDSQVTSKGRTEQQYLRKVLFGKRVIDKCCICGRSLPVGMLWAAHIKKRSVCTLDERKDFKNIVAPMCKLGCDELYEKKYLFVDSNGYVVIAKDISNYPDLNDYISGLAGKKCLVWNENNKKYFDWHSKSLINVG